MSPMKITVSEARPLLLMFSVGTPRYPVDVDAMWIRRSARVVAVVGEGGGWCREGRDGSRP